MAKTKAKKVTPVKRWVVRESDREDGDYILFVGPRPRRIKKKWQTHTDDFIGFFCPEQFERFCHADCHLKPNGGPVEIKVVKVKQVKP